MSKGMIITISAGVLLIIFIIWAFFWTMGVNKQEIVLKNKLEAQVNLVETTLDTMVKKIKNQYKVKEDFAKDFIAVVMAQTEGRKGGSLIKASTEAANTLGITSELYQQMMNTVAGELDSFKRSQDIMTDVWLQHKNWCEDPYHNILWLSLADKVKPRPEMISGGKAKDAMETKNLDDNLLE